MEVTKQPCQREWFMPWLNALIDSVREIFHATDEQITALMNDMLSRLPEHLRNCMTAV